MLSFLLGFSVVWMVLGALMVLYTSQTRNVFRVLVSTMKPGVWAFVALPFGVAFIAGAFLFERVFWLALIVGLLAVVKGVYLAFAPAAQIQSLMDWWFDRAGERLIRLWGLFAFTLGILFFARLI